MGRRRNRARANRSTNRYIDQYTSASPPPRHKKKEDKKNIALAAIMGMLSTNPTFLVRKDQFNPFAIRVDDRAQGYFVGIVTVASNKVTVATSPDRTRLLFSSSPGDVTEIPMCDPQLMARISKALNDAYECR